MFEVIQNYERQLVNGFIFMYLDRGYTISDMLQDCLTLEREISEITGNKHCDHRRALYDYIEHELTNLQFAIKI